MQIPNNEKKRTLDIDLSPVKSGARQCYNTTECLHKRHHKRKALMFQSLESKEGGASA
jgi:hypothetical protein